MRGTRIFLPKRRIDGRRTWSASLMGLSTRGSSHPGTTCPLVGTGRSSSSTRRPVRGISCHLEDRLQRTLDRSMVQIVRASIPGQDHDRCASGPPRASASIATSAERERRACRARSPRHVRNRVEGIRDAPNPAGAACGMRLRWPRRSVRPRGRRSAAWPGSHDSTGGFLALHDVHLDLRHFAQCAASGKSWKFDVLDAASLNVILP